MKRRAFIPGLGIAVAWPLLARAQQRALPIVGIVSTGDEHSDKYVIDAFRRGLTEAGYTDGRNVIVETRYMENNRDRLPTLISSLIDLNVSVLVGNLITALAAKSATNTIPIVFGVGGDPVLLGLVSSLNRPGANATGVSFFAPLLEAKRFNLLHEAVPEAKTIGVLFNPSNPHVDTQINQVNEAAKALNITLYVKGARNEREIGPAFAEFAGQQVGALLVCADPFFNSERPQIILLAARSKLPAIYEWREFTEAGGLMSYGTSLTDSYRQVGMYTAKVLNGTKPADLPVLQATKFEFLINLRTAKALGIQIPPALSARADEVIE